mgnify:CR=1 FL=1
MLVLNKLRIRFQRGEEAKYISHLDIIKVFERALKRANISVEYTKGRNSHPQMVFGLPLPVGITSEAEYVDIDLKETIEPEQFLKRVNNSFPAGFKILAVEYNKSGDNIMASIRLASYDIILGTINCDNIEELENCFLGVLSRVYFLVKKVSKGRTKEINARPFIKGITVKVFKKSRFNKELNKKNRNINICNNDFLLKYLDNLSKGTIPNSRYSIDNTFCLSITVSAGSTANLNPVLFLSGFNKEYKTDLEIVKMHRTGLYGIINDSVKNPMDYNVLQ